MIRYVKLSISIHGLGIKEERAIDFLKGLIKQETLACLTGEQKSLFNFRNEFDSDIEVEVEEYAGSAGE